MTALCPPPRRSPRPRASNRPPRRPARRRARKRSLPAPAAAWRSSSRCWPPAPTPPSPAAPSACPTRRRCRPRSSSSPSSPSPQGACRPARRPPPGPPWRCSRPSRRGRPSRWPGAWRPTTPGSRPTARWPTRWWPCWASSPGRASRAPRSAPASGCSRSRSRSRSTRWRARSSRASSTGPRRRPGCATAVPPVALAFAHRSLADPAPLHDRIAGGWLLAGVLAAGLLALLGAGWLALRAESRVAWRPGWSRAIWAALATAAVAGAVALLATGAVARAVHDFGRADLAPSISAPSRLLSTNSGNRWTWWREAAGAWSARPVLGHGAGSFEVLHLQYRDDLLQVRQPHDLPLQFRAETGVAGALLGIGGILALLWTALGAARRSPERVALAAAGMAWAVHTLVDWDWDIP